VKKLFILIVTLTIILSTGAIKPVQAQTQHGDIQVFIDGLPVDFDVKPVIKNDRTLVPFRAVAEMLNVKVSWDGARQTVNASDGEISVMLQIGNKTAYRNGTPVVLDVPPVIINDRTLIPLRFFSEAFDCRVEWDGVTRYVQITSPPRAMTVVGFYALGDRETSSWTDLFNENYPSTGSGNTDVVSVLALGWYSLDEQGNLITDSKSGWRLPDGWEDVLAAAGKYNLETEMVVHLTDGEGTLSNLLTDEAAMSRAIGDITKEAALYQGVNLDFEGLGWRAGNEELVAVRQSFNRFVQLLSGQLKEINRSLTLTLHPPNSAYKGYDYRELGRYADRIIVMAYDYGTVPEPLELVIEAVERARADVPPEKLVLGISIPSETVESIPAKVGIAKRYNLEGIAIWRLGLVLDEIWSILRSTVASRQLGS
jgi:hypothetical protein